MRTFELNRAIFQQLQTSRGSHMLLLKLLIGYIIFSQIIVVFWVGMASYAVNGGKLRWALDENSQPINNTAVNIKAFLLIILTAPVTLIMMVNTVISCLRESRRVYQELAGNFRAMLLEPLHECNIPVELATYLSEQDYPADFELLGDFWLKEDPINSKARIHLSNDHRVFAEVGVTLDTLYLSLIHI